MLQGGATIINEPHGTWSLATGPVEPQSSSSGETFDNEGTLTTTGTEGIDVPLDQQRHRDDQLGDPHPRRRRHASSSGSFTVAASSTLDFDSSYALERLPAGSAARAA